MSKLVVQENIKKTQSFPVWYSPVTLHWLSVEDAVWSSRCSEAEMQQLEIDTMVCKNQDINKTIPGKATENGKTFERMIEQLHARIVE